MHGVEYISPGCSLLNSRGRKGGYAENRHIMIEDLMDDQKTRKGRADDGACPDLDERRREPDAAVGEASPVTTTALPNAHATILRQ